MVDDGNTKVASFVGHDLKPYEWQRSMTKEERFRKRLTGCKARHLPFEMGYVFKVLLSLLTIPIFFNGVHAESPFVVPLEVPSGLLPDAKKCVSTNTGDYGLWISPIRQESQSLVTRRPFIDRGR